MFKVNNKKLYYKQQQIMLLNKIKQKIKKILKIKFKSHYKIKYNNNYNSNYPYKITLQILNNNNNSSKILSQQK